YLRILDDAGDQFLSKHQREQQGSFGEVVKRDGSRQRLEYREAANKIIHAASYRWDKLPDTGQPFVTCLAGKPQNARDDWSEASVDLVALFRIFNFLWLIM